MSATTTDNPITLTIQRTLADYDLHISGETGPNSSQSPIEPPNAIHNTPQVSNPHNWPRDYHRVPNYRPINRNLDMVQRPNGSSGPETAFITVMFTGIAINAGAAQLWSKTGGKIFTKVFKYAIGGEW